MRAMMMGVALAIAAGCNGTVPIQIGGAGGTGTGGGTAPQAAQADPRAAVQEMVNLVNAHRRSVRCPELAWLPGAASAAQGHSEDMARRNYFDHVSPEGRGPAERLAAQGVALRALAENIALHHGNPRQVLQDWLDSPEHRQNLESCLYTYHGVGVRNGYWTHVFVTPP